MSAPAATTTEPIAHARVEPSDAGRAASWRDRKRYYWLLGLVVPTLPFLAWGLVELTGLGAFWFYGPVLVFGIFPLLDLAVGVDARNPPESMIKALEQDRYYRWCTYAYIPVQYGGLIFACWEWSHGGLSVVESIGLALTVAMVSGIAINTAHELGHKRASLERWLSKVALAQSGYGHFFIEHNRGHHVRVATPEDPASSRLGESFYRFLPRTVIGSLRSAWELERVRLRRLESSMWTPRNDILSAWAMTVVLFGALVAVFGVVVLPADPGRARLLAARGGELPGALRPLAPAPRGRSLRAYAPGAQLELEQHRIERAALPPATSLRPPREPCAPLPGAAPRRAGAAATDGIRGHDPHGRDPAAVAARDGPSRARALRRRRDADEPQPAGEVAPAAASRYGRMSAYGCPACGYVYDEAVGHPREGFPAGTRWSEVPDDWACPDCGVRDKVDFEPVEAPAS
jgi:alkane 1-monooxygenase